MKKYFLLTIAVVLGMLSANAQYKMKVTLKNGQETQFNVSEIENVTWQEIPIDPGYIPDDHEDHEYVDLGLSVKWATCNIGAIKPEDYGDYYAWGETETKSTYDWSTYKWCKGSETTLTKYCTDSKYGTVDNKEVLEPSDDVAHVKWGGNWRMPTKAEIDELLDSSERTWTRQNGVFGYKVTSKKNGNSIFLPAAGYRRGDGLNSKGSYGNYWSSSFSPNDDNAYDFVFCSSFWRWISVGRCSGRSVRGVCP